MAQYSKLGFILYLGRPALQTESISLKGDSGNKDVFTSLLGRAGFTAGPFACTIAVKSAIPSDGPEVDWFGLCASHTEIPLGFNIGGSTYNFTGDVRDCGISTEATGNPNAIDFNFHCTFVGVQ